MIAAALAAFLLAGEPAAAAAPRPFDRACMDDYGRDLCDPAMRAGIRRKFGVPPAEDLAAQGVEGVRAFMVNGYSRDMPLVTVLRPRGGEAALAFHVPDRPELARSAPASRWQWQVSQALGGLASAAPEQPAPAPAPKGEVRICLHPWVAVVEVIAGGKVTTRVRNGCVEDGVYDGAYSLSTEALRSFEGCTALEPRNYRNDVERLYGCAILRGDDGHAEAELLNWIHLTPLVDTPGPRGLALQDWLAPDVAVLTPEGQTLSGPEAVGGLVARQEALGAAVGVSAIAADGLGGATVKGKLYLEGPGDQESAAPYEQAWRLDDDGNWRMKTWKIEPFAKVVAPPQGL